MARSFDQVTSKRGEIVEFCVARGITCTPESGIVNHEWHTGWHSIGWYDVAGIAVRASWRTQHIDLPYTEGCLHLADEHHIPCAVHMAYTNEDESGFLMWLRCIPLGIRCPDTGDMLWPKVTFTVEGPKISL